MIIIIGAGLSGLLTAYRLKEGIPFKILKARNRIGGRINTVYRTDNTPVEMGATWFGKQHKHLRPLWEELGVEYFEQYMDGTVFFQPFSTSAAEFIQIPSQSYKPAVLECFRMNKSSSNFTMEELYKMVGITISRNTREIVNSAKEIHRNINEWAAGSYTLKKNLK